MDDEAVVEVEEDEEEQFPDAPEGLHPENLENRNPYILTQIFSFGKLSLIFNLLIL